VLPDDPILQPASASALATPQAASSRLARSLANMLTPFLDPDRHHTMRDRAETKMKQR
jgi:hypothetical protein